MEILDALMNRVSTGSKRLKEPGPSDAELKQMLQASMSAPDHGGLKPWRFIVVQGEARRTLADLFAEHAERIDPAVEQKEIDRQRDKALGPPVTLVVVAQTVENEKVPDYEQLITAGIAAFQVQLAAYSMGYGSILVSGKKVDDDQIKAAFDVAKNERIIGFISLGRQETIMPKARKSAEDMTHYWSPGGA